MIMFLQFTILLVIGLAAGDYVTRDESICSNLKPGESVPVCNWHYIAYFPRFFTHGVTEQFALSTHGYPEEVTIRISLIDDNEKVYSENTFQVKPETLTNYGYYIGDDAPRSVKVVVEGFGLSVNNQEWYFKNESKNIYIEKHATNMFIETDRPMYKPGQKIQGRVIVVDPKLRPLNGQLDSIVIENPSGSRMRQWNNVTLEEGFVSFSLNTSTKPVLGKWKIVAKMGSLKEEITIELKEYVLPKFQVTITPPSFLTVTSKHVKIEVCARYSYGKKVYGEAKVKLCRVNRYRYSWRRYDAPDAPAPASDCHQITAKIHGCRTFKVDSTELNIKPQSSTYGSARFDVEMEADVKEFATGLKLKANKVDIQVQKTEVALTFETHDYFKPGLPLSIKLFAKYPDGTPIPSLKVRLNVGTEDYRITSNIIDNEEVTITNGVYKVVLPPLPYDAKRLKLHAKYVREKLYRGERDYEREASAYENITPWYSPSHSYLQIETPKETMKFGSDAEFTVHYTTSSTVNTEKKIYYSIMCAGNIAASSSIKQTFKGQESPIFGKKIVDTRPIKADNVDRIDEEEDGDVDVFPTLNLPKIADPTRPPLPLSFSTGKFKFTFEVNKNMFPKCRMVMYYMQGREIVADSVNFDVDDVFDNKVNIGLDLDEVKPGNQIKLIMKAAPRSRFAITAVDKSIHFLAKGNDLKKKDLTEARERLDISPGWVQNYGRCSGFGYGRKKRDIAPGIFGGNNYVDSEKAFVNIGVDILTNLQLDVRPCAGYTPYFELDSSGPDNDNSGPGEARKVDSVVSGKKKIAAPSVRPRTHFPDTWLFEDGRVSDDGTYSMQVKVPDTITSWYASGFAISKQAGLGVADAIELKVFQPFFISLNLPYSVIRGEDVTIPAAIFSYLDEACISIKVTLAYSTDYRMIAGPSAKSCICGGRTATVLFRIKPKKLGHINIRISAETLPDNLCAAGRKVDNSVNTADILVKKLLVEPEGVKKSYTVSNLVCPTPNKQYKEEMKLEMPSNLVIGSIHSKITVVGDVMGSSLENLDELIKMPYGCGEQNMLRFAPNIFVMNYLNKTNQMTKKIKEKSLNFMRTGYQRELTYKHKDGSYSAFGERDVNGSTWLTAFVLKSYAQAREWIDIDDKEINEPMKWLLSHQNKDGCFDSIGYLHSKSMKGGVKSPVTLTAYVLISLLEADLKHTDPRAEEASLCVSNYINDVKDSYSLNIIAYMFAKMKDNARYQFVMEKLSNMAIKEDGMTHYEEKKEKTETDYFYYQARSTDIEQTAYALLALAEKQGAKGVSEQVPIVRWLSKQRNGLGGWSSTQDTVLAMQALSEFAAFTYGDTLEMRVNVQAMNKEFRQTFDVNRRNNLVLQRVEDVPVASVISVTATGSGCSVVQAIVNYNTQKVKESAFDIHYSMESIPTKLNSRRSCMSQNLTVCVQFTGLHEKESNMALVEVTMVSGFEADQESLDVMKRVVKGLKDIEFKDKNVVFYFNRISKNDKCFTIRVDQTSNVRKTKPVPITVYDYYDTEKAATKMYHFTKNQCIGARS